MVGFKEIKDIASILKEAGKIDEYSKILELQQQLLDFQNKIGNLEKENKDLKDKFKIKENLIFKINSYYNGEDGPFCSRCWDKNNETIRIIPNWIGCDYATCPECKNSVNYTGKEEQTITTEPDFSVY